MFKSALHDLRIQICHLILGVALPTFLGSATAYARQMQCLHRAQPAIGIPAAARQWVTGLVLKQLSRCAKWDDGSGSVNAAPEGQLRVVNGLSGRSASDQMELAETHQRGAHWHMEYTSREPIIRQFKVQPIRLASNHSLVALSPMAAKRRPR